MTTMTDAAFTDDRYPRHARLWEAVAAALPAGEMAHDAAHLQRVYTWALRLAAHAGADADLAGAAALVHDLVFIAKNHADRPLAGERSAVAGRTLLVAAGYSADEAVSVAEAVRTCSWSRGLAPRDILGRILQDADRLDALGAIGVMRTIACHQHFSTAAAPGAFYHPHDPAGDDPARPLDDTAYALDHLPAKLLRLADAMHLAPARAEAARRHRFLVAMLAEVRRELGCRPPL